MKKIKLLLLILSILFLGCSKDLTKEEALKLAQPAIESILDYKKTNGIYPKNLKNVKDFPYKIKEIDTNEYSFISKKYRSYTIYYYFKDSGKKASFKITFFGNKIIRSINIYFEKDGSYKVNYSAGSLGPGA
jgi:major membrane immunogen (membrane-anchored lipoprotein)